MLVIPLIIDFDCTVSPATDLLLASTERNLHLLCPPAHPHVITLSGARHRRIRTTPVFVFVFAFVFAFALAFAFVFAFASATRAKRDRISSGL
jgi:hypothetical protein